MKIIARLAFLVCVIVELAAPSRADWIQDMRHDAPKAAAPKPAKVKSPVVRWTPPPAGTTSARTGGRPLTQEQIDEGNALWAPFWSALRTAHDLFDAGHYAQAAAVLEAEELNIEPTEWGPWRGNSMVLTLLADCYFQMNQPGQAFAAIAPNMWPGRSDQEVLLRASLAAARCGHVYEGQRAYLWSVIHHMSGVVDDAHFLPQGNSPAAIDAMTCIALAITTSGESKLHHYYTSEALRVDPGNPIACLFLAQEEGSKAKRHYTQAVHLCELGMQRATGTIRDDLKELWIGMDYLKRQFGDGG